jgi:succinate dehydrogenase/fumarate reductase flavoprotein subunit
MTVTDGNETKVCPHCHYYYFIHAASILQDQEKLTILTNTSLECIELLNRTGAALSELLKI